MQAKDFKNIEDQETRALLFYALREHDGDHQDSNSRLFSREIASAFGPHDGTSLQDILRSKKLIVTDICGMNQITPKGIEVLAKLNLIKPTELLFHSNIWTRQAVADYLKGEK